VVIYAFGLGPTSPAVAAGSASPTPAATSTNYDPAVPSRFRVQFNFTPNVVPSSSAVIGSLSGDAFPVFAGLTPGAVGLYQLNIQLPKTIPLIPSCGTPMGASEVTSNLTITVGSGSSFDGAAICVQPGP
jgi:uncharacterized protein (TIGR03437 family)